MRKLAAASLFLLPIVALAQQTINGGNIKPATLPYTAMTAETSAQLAGWVSDETGSGFLVFGTSPSLVTPALGAATATTLNGNTFTSGPYTLTGVSGKVLTFSNTLTLAGTDGTTITFPATSATVARTDAAQTFTGVQTFSTPVAVTSGGTGLASYAVGDILYADTTTTIAKLADVTAGAFLRAGGVNTAPVWSSIFLSNALTTGDLWSASASNTMSRITAVASGQVLTSAGTSTLPAWSASPTLTTVTATTVNATNHQIGGVTQTFPKTFTATYDPASLAAATTRCDTVTFTGIATTGGAVAVNPGANFSTSCVIAAVRASATNTVTICLRNTVDAVTACDEGSSTWTATQAQ